MRTLSPALGLALLLGLQTLGWAQTEDADAYGDDYAPGTFGRIRYVENGATIERAPAEDRPSSEEKVRGNEPIFPGDILRTASTERAEAQLGDGSLVRLDRDGQLVFLSLPDPYAKVRDNTVLQLVRGTVQLLPRLEGEEDFRVDTPSASVYLLGQGEFRIEVEETGATRVVSRRGVAEVSAENGSVLVRAGMSASVVPGEAPEGPTPFSTFARDRFDRWCESRDEAFRVKERIAGRGSDEEGEPELPDEVRPYYGELSTYGRWVWVPAYGWAWYPVGVGPDWRPYFDGYWAYGPYGYFWVSYEPWGWAPYHFGRWVWVGGIGWCWIPGRVFAGAWVAWSWGPTFVGWCPLDFWNRPAFVATVQLGFYDPVAWTFVRVEHVVVRDVRRHAVPIAAVRPRLRDHVVVARAPRVEPRKLAVSADWRERAARLAAEDRAARLRPVAREASPRERFRDVELRKIERLPARPAGRAQEVRVPPPAQRSPGARPVPRATELPRPAHPKTTPTERPGAGISRDREGSRGEPMAARPYPRRIVEQQDRSGTDRGSSARRRPDPAEARRQEAARPGEVGDRREAGTRERVREMYRQLARPRVIERPGTAPSPPALRAEPQSRDRAGQPSRTNPPEVRPGPGPRPARPDSHVVPPRTAAPRASAPAPPASKRPEAARPEKPQRAAERPKKKDKD
jgi:hypothetical protein